MTKSTKWHVRPAKIQISLGIRPVGSESSLPALDPQLPTERTAKTLIRLGGCPGSDWADTQADLSIRWAHTQFVDFVMLRPILLMRRRTSVSYGLRSFKHACAVIR